MPSAIAQVVPALVGVIASALPTVQVFNGPKPTSQFLADYVCVAFDPAGDTDGVAADQVPASLGNRWVDESGDVTCSVTCQSGNQGVIPALLARADALLDAADAALRANPTLGGVLVAGAADGSYARVLGRTTYGPATGDEGSVVRLGFTVHYSTLLV